MAIITGTNGPDSLTGTPDDDEIHGLEGNDVLRGLAGADRLYGGDGFDIITGGLGDDLVDGGAGNDRASYGASATAGVTVDLRLLGVAQNTGSQGFDTLVGIEHVSGTNFDDVLTGNDGDNWLWGGSGMTGNDVIRAGAGNDQIMVGRGNHVLDGGCGSDIWNLYGNGPDVTSAGVTASLLLQGQAQDTEQGITTATGFEHMSGTLYDDTLTGDRGDNVLAGGESGSDHLVGGKGNDTLIGDGMFTFVGGENILVDNSDFAHGNDVLEGGQGHDILNGGEGNDTLSGGSGHDRFVFGGTTFFGGRTVASGQDVITDFQKKDVLEFDFTGLDDMSDLNIVQNGANVVITWGAGADSITLEHFKAKHLSADNFDFGAASAASAGPDSSWMTVKAYDLAGIDYLVP